MIFRAFATILALTLGVSAPAAAADVLAIGEIHDNPQHHAIQAKKVAALQPAAIVFEMLTAEQAALITPALREDPDALARALDWSSTGWPDFEYYHPIMTAARQAQIYGAGVPRDTARAAISDGVVAAFGPDASQYGLTAPLPDEQQAARLLLQADAHCDALPADMLPAMIDIQRLRDAVLARTTLDALADTGGPVAVIAGNGHLRRDWGMPALLLHAAPDVTLHVIGQGEDAAPPSGAFDEVIDAPAVDRPDPCAAFK